jgi:DNA mismatch repair protein MutS
MSKTPPPANPTPAMRQFHQFKEQYPDAILFFRMGDFYETFYEDAEICSRVLGISLTCRNKTSDHPIPLAGVPYHAVEKYLHNMIKAGYKVAVCEQMEDPAQAKGVVKRDVVRLVTAGTLTEEALLDEREENFLAAICFDPANADLNGKHPVGLAWVELSTGQFFSQLVESRFLLDELVRLRPTECLIADDTTMAPKGFFDQLKETTQSVVTRRSGWTFDQHHALSLLQKHFSVVSLEGFGYSSIDSSACAAGVIIDYLNETQKTTLGHIATLRRASRDRFLKLDQTTLRSLEIEKTLKENSVKGSLRQTLDKTVTAMGSRKFRNWICFPLVDLEQIELRQDAISELLREDNLRDTLRQSLNRICDIERVTSRISTGRAGPRDLLSLAQALHELPAIETLLKNVATDLLVQMRQQCTTQEKTADLIDAAIDPDAKLTLRDGGIIRSGYHEEVDRLRGLCQDGQTWLAGYQKRLIDQTGFSNLKVGFNRVFGYYVEISHAFRGQLPGDFIRKQTLKNAERYITDELKKYESEALTAVQRCKSLEESLFYDLRKQVAAQTLHLQQVADAVARLDVLGALAHLARQQNYCRPQMHPENDMEIIEGRHPVLDLTLGSDFIPNDVQLGDGTRDLVLITGPNMSGKSTYIRQTALLVLLAHTGSFIPAQKAQIGLVDRIFTRVGASDELTRGQSTFMVEMIETANIVNNATERSLVILDEIGRGTSTYDGLSLAWAIVEHIATRIKCRTLFATHYHEITELANLLENVDNANVSVREWKEEVIFLHKILPGRTDKSYGIHVARLAGLPRPVLERANEILQELENNFACEAQDPHLGGRLKKQTGDKQLLLFDPPPATDRIHEKLLDCDVEKLTPLQALNFLEELKNELS